MITNLQLANSLSTILNTFISLRAYFYQNVLQNSYKNSGLETYQINYNLLLPGSALNTNLREADVGAQMQAYIDLCQAFIKTITTQQNFQNNLFYEQIQNELNNSISQLNGFAEGLLNSKYAKLTKYKIPYTMSLSEAMFLNNLDISTYEIQTGLNYNLSDFNNIPINTEITLTL